MPEPASNPVTPRKIAVSLSGGGVRALLFGLGALRAVLAACERQGHDLQVLAGVSGGAIGAAYAASRLDLSQASVAEYNARVLRPAVATITHHSMMFGRWYFPVVVGVAGLLALCGIGLLVAAFWLDWRLCVAGSVASLLAAAILISFRGPAYQRSMREVLFGRDSLLGEADGGTHLVLQASDRTSGEATFLTSRFLYSYRWGQAPPGNTSLVGAALASATFPIVFGAFRLRNHSFPGGEQPKPPKVLSLVDGGIYENMGSEWLLNTDHTREDVYKIVVNASRNLGLSHAQYRIPIIGDALTLLRERNIQYDATTAPRRRWLHALFIAKPHSGTLVAIDGSIPKWVHTFANGADVRGQRATAILEALKSAHAEETMDAWPKFNSAVATSLGTVAMEQAHSLVRAGYLAAAIQTHILEDWPSPEAVDPNQLMPWLGQPAE